MNAAMSVGDLCSRDTVVAQRVTTLVEAARMMRERHVGCLVVVEESPAGQLPVGVITDRDLVTAVLARDVEVHALRVDDVASDEPVIIREKASLPDALALMQAKGVRRVIVADEAGLLQGVLALDDVIEAVAEQMQAISKALTSGRPREAKRRP
jgi:CBS domain-containing protein